MQNSTRTMLIEGATCPLVKDKAAGCTAFRVIEGVCNGIRKYTPFDPLLLVIFSPFTYCFSCTACLYIPWNEMLHDNVDGDSLITTYY